MHNICRFCLKVSIYEMYKLHENDILSKIQSNLSLQIITDESYPNQLCKGCVNKIEEINKFCSVIKENQHKLQNFLSSATIHDNYLKQTSNTQIKEELNENIIYCESKYLKTEDCSTNDSKNKLETHKNINKDDFTISKCDNTMKTEEHADDSFNEPLYSTDDEISLSSIKKETVLNTNISKKRINNRQKENSKRKKDIATTKSFDMTMDSVKQFTCLSCTKPCQSQTDLIKHYHEQHLNKSGTTTKRNYTVIETNSIVTYKCDICDKTYDSKRDIVRHADIHNDERPLICKLCGRTYKKVTDIIRHARVHNGFKLQCSYNCGYSTAYQGALKEHENRHLDVCKYTCEKCGKGFNVKTWFEQHQNIHTGLKPFVCEICGLAFHMDRYLKTHKSSIHPQSSSVKRYICMHCNQKCDSANSLTLHLEEHGINREKDFLCDFCGKILSNATQLKYHHRMHSGVKPYSCSICNKSFAKKFYAKIHMNSHSGEKTHACARCGKRYAQKSTMLRHLKRHHASTSPNRNG